MTTSPSAAAGARKRRAGADEQSVLTFDKLPERLTGVDHLEDVMTTPSQALIDDLARLDGDILVLGAGGKMGPTLAGLAKRAAPDKRVLAVARFSEAGVKERLASWDVETLACDLLDREAVAAIPKLPNVVYMAGRKFGTSEGAELTWAMNAYVPAIVADAFGSSRIVVFSTIDVYPYTSVLHQGATEDVPPNPPPGEYANSCVGRERIFEYFSGLHGTEALIFRLCYVIDMRYGVLHDVARKVRDGEAINLAMGHVSMMWQGDANAQALRCLRHCAAPPVPLNISGPEPVSIRSAAEAFGRYFGKQPRFVGTEEETAWVVNPGRAERLFGYPMVPLARMIEWTADWVANERPSLEKPTHYDTRDGAF